jgi:hypothetical protein
MGSACFEVNIHVNKFFIFALKLNNYTMTTLIIEIPDSDASEISNIVRARGGNVVQIVADDEDLTPAELALLKRGLGEALLIKEGKIKSIPFSELWND